MLVVPLRSCRSLPSRGLKVCSRRGCDDRMLLRDGPPYAQTAYADATPQPFWPTWKLAISSSARTIAEWSQAFPPCAAQALNNSCAVAVFGSERPIARALDNARL